MQETLFSLTIKDLEFYAKHGLYKGEKKINQKFNINVNIIYTINIKDKISIDQCIDYVEITSIIKEVMKHSEDLMETLILNIRNEIMGKYSNIQKCNISIKKYPQLNAKYEYISIEI
jgi:dihydroneopterin aldolase